MKFCNRKDLMLLTTVLCGVAGLGANMAKAEFVPTRGDDAAYTVSEATEENHDFAYAVLDDNNVPQYEYYNWSLNTDNIAKNSISITTEGATAENHDFKVAHGTDVDGNPVYDYFKYSISTNPEAAQVVKDLSVESATGSVYGGANSAISETDTISTTFINNHVSSSASGSEWINRIISGGGAISNTATITSINADFINNFANATGADYSYAQGGAVYNTGTISKIDEATGEIIGGITGNFIGNYASASRARGGAVHNKGTIGDITGDFVGNYASGKTEAQGGAVFNDYDGTINSIIGSFICNYVLGQTGAYGGAVLNEYGETITSISGNIVGNYASGKTEAQGGAVFNRGTIGKIDEETGKITEGISGDFIGNYASASNSSGSSGAYGGGVSNYGSVASIGNITGDFVGNYASASNSSGPSWAYGGAVYSFWSGITIGNITGDFVGNYAKASSPSGSSSAQGGAVYTGRGTITSITGDFVGNYASGKTKALGGALFNEDGTIGDIAGNFVGNYASGSSAGGGAVYNTRMYNETRINSISGDFIGNYASGSSNAQGGAVYNGDTITSITGDFVGNYASASNSSGYSAIGGAVLNWGTITSITGDFVGNYASGKTEALGGALLNGGTITFVADKTDEAYEDDILFQGNYITLDSGITKDAEAIYNNGTLNLESRGGGSYTLYDYINTNHGSTINFSGDGTGILNLYNDIKGQNTINIEKSYIWNMVNEKNNLVQSSFFNIKAPTTLKMDMALADNGSSDYFDVSIVTGAENMMIDKLNITSDMEDDTYALKFDYASSLMTKASEHKVNTSGGVYTIRADGKRFSVYRESASGGYENFLADLKNEGSARSYSFTADESMKRFIGHGSEGLWVDGENLDLTIFGNKRTLTAETKENSLALKLAEGQKASMSDLTISGFDTALETVGELALNGVTIKNSNTGLKLGANVELSGINTFEGNGTDLEAVVKTYLSTEYPLSAAYMDFVILSGAMNNGMSYQEMLQEMMKNAPISDQITNGAEYMDAMIKYATETGEEEIPENDLAFINQMFGGALTEEDYNSLHTATSKNPELFVVYAEELNSLKEIGYNLDDVVAVYNSNSDAPLLAMKHNFELKAATKDMTEEEFWEFVAEKYNITGPTDKISNFDDVVNYLVNEYLADGKEEQDVLEIEEYEKVRAFIDKYPELAILAMSGDIKPEELEQLPELYKNMYVAAKAPDQSMYFDTSREDVNYAINMKEDAVLNLNGKVDGADVYGLTFAGSKDSLISLGKEATINKADLVLDGPTLKLADESTNLANVNSFEARSGTLDLQNDVVRALVAQDFSITGAINLLVDADLANKTMDTLGDVTVADGGSINVSGIKILSDGVEELTQIDFAGEEYKDKVSTSVKEVLSTQYTYKVVYNEETGQFEFVREAKLAPEDSAVNRGSSIANAGAVMLTEAVSQRALGADVVKSQGASSGDAFGLKAWVQTFGSRDDVELKHLSPTIDAKFYGVLGGIDSKTFAYDNGVKATYGVYGAYTRSEQKYSGNKIKQKGGYFGLKALFKKGGLFSKLTANMGFLNNEAHTSWGKDKFDTKVISAATQTGYDFKLKPSKVPFNLRGEKPFYEMNMDVTITPSLYVGYMGIDTDDYTNKAGTAIKNKFMNVVEIAPELKVANNFGNGLEGYLKGAYKMFIYDNDQVKVDTALLPSMSIKPYVEYGFGFEKTFNSAKAYGDIMRHNGGKEGWDFNLGIKLEF